MYDIKIITELCNMQQNLRKKCMPVQLSEILKEWAIHPTGSVFCQNSVMT